MVQRPARRISKGCSQRSHWSKRGLGPRAPWRLLVRRGRGLSVGFPLSLAAGLVLMQIDLPSLRLVFGAQLEQAWMFMAQMAGIGALP